MVEQNRKRLVGDGGCQFSLGDEGRSLQMGDLNVVILTSAEQSVFNFPPAVEACSLSQPVVTTLSCCHVTLRTQFSHLKSLLG